MGLWPCTPWDHPVENHATTHPKEAPARAQGTDSGSPHESMGEVSSGKLFPWGRSEGTEERQRDPSPSLWLFPHTSKELVERKRALVKLCLCHEFNPTAGWPAGSLTSPWLWGRQCLGTVKAVGTVSTPQKGEIWPRHFLKTVFLWACGFQEDKSHPQTQQQGKDQRVGTLQIKFPGLSLKCRTWDKS